MKSSSWCLEVRIARNSTREVTEKQRAISDETAKRLKADWCAKFGSPFFSLKLPGTVADVAKAMVAMRVETREQEVEVLFSHLPPLFTRSEWASVKISFGVNSLSL